MITKRLLLAAYGCFAAISATVFANGGAWQIGVPSTGNAAATDQKHSTNVAIEDEGLTIDLHQEFAAVEVRYRMKNTGAKVVQDFFFPVERWTALETEETGAPPPDLQDYRITADGADLKWTDVATGTKTTSAPDEEWGDLPPSTKGWKKSEIPFGPNQSREIVIRYRTGYSGSEGSVSDDVHGSEQVLAYSLSPAATWKGPIAHGKIVINALEPQAEEMRIEKPADRFQKAGERRYVWEFTDLKPTLADDLKIVVHPEYNEYPVSYGENVEALARPDYVLEGDHYFILHADFDAVASSTLAPAGAHKYDVKNIRSIEPDLAWAEGVDGDGIGESITLSVTHPLPLAAILIVPGYRSETNPSLWEKNNRVAELEVTLNGTHTFTAKIPDEKFAQPYPIPVRDFAEPVKTVKLTIKAVHRGTGAHDTCISQVRLKAKLTEKPEIHPAR